MAISVDLSTIPLSATTASHGGTVRWMSPELLFNQNRPPTCQSDCYALGMVIYEVSRSHSSGASNPSFICLQVLTGLQPFRHLNHYTVPVAVQKGEHPSKPDNAESLGFSDTLWRLIQECWSESPSTRPTAQQLLHYLEGASRDWTPPLEYPIPDNLHGGAGLGLTSGDDRSGTTGTPASIRSLIDLLVNMSLIPACSTKP